MKPSHLKILVAAGLLSAAAAGAATATDLKEPFRVEADGKAIETEGGNAAPCLMDFDQDGTWDLLVGQFKDGKVRVFRNTGTKTAPKFAAGVFLKSGGADMKVPAG